MTGELTVRRSSVGSSRLPLVYASRRALEDARPLLPEGAVLEREAERAIREGAVVNGNGGGFVFLDEHGVVCRYAKVPRRFGGDRRAWLITSVVRNRKRR